MGLRLQNICTMQVQDHSNNASPLGQSKMSSLNYRYTGKHTMPIDIIRISDAIFPRDFDPSTRLHPADILPVPSTIEEEESIGDTHSASLPDFLPSALDKDNDNFQGFQSLQNISTLPWAEPEPKPSKHKEEMHMRTMSAPIAVPDSVPVFRESMLQLRRRSCVENIITE